MCEKESTSSVLIGGTGDAGCVGPHEEGREGGGGVLLTCVRQDVQGACVCERG